MSPVRICAVPGCPNLTRRTRCEPHEAAHQRARNHRRPQYQGTWQADRRRARAEHPWCTRCGRTKDQLDALGIRLSLDHETGTVECVPCNSAHRRNPPR